ncbi:hypothetical protein [Arthrobacter sp. M4]|uniref:hypothetical protein n=1 Tax=Arthrobacter sp. M4 TaxID=218160 RepID=UPI001CDBE325|nr:hypothetical protein [Arthrobacter sp. M4]MCA4131765.1 hypothetical protein [Arthrobacter sp. M4]
MNTEPEEIGPEVPEADALEQRTPVLAESTEESTVPDLLPDDVPQPDFIDQHTDVQPGSVGFDGIAATEAEAAEADLLDQATELPTGNDDDYPGAGEDAG